jgi:hypothetical protein
MFRQEYVEVVHFGGGGQGQQREQDQDAHINSNCLNSHL